MNRILEFHVLSLAGLCCLCLAQVSSVLGDEPASVAGITVVPHRIEETLRFRTRRDPSLAAKVQLFIKGPALPGAFAGKTPSELLQSQDWAWHDLATAVKPPQGALTVWTFNGKASRWGIGQKFTITGEGLTDSTIEINQPDRWISSVTFLSSDDSVQPDTAVLHIANETDATLSITGLKFWLPESGKTWQVLWPQNVVPVIGSIASKDRGFIKVSTGKLPLTYAALELQTTQGPLWAHLRIKREAFDISGGWVNGNLTKEPYLKLLAQLHVNTGQIDRIGGYTDNPELYERFPIKLFNRLVPLEQWDTDQWLPRIHAVEFIGEPQYGGGKPVSPQEVFDLLLPYRVSRMPTSVTLSEERTWRWYAGLSDFPHYDAYRVVAPAADAWREYDRWGGVRIGWGAPLETIGDMCRSLRELSRPVPCAYWSQGPHDGWGGGFLSGGRARRSPTPDELRSQAMHALSSRITSLYWFNLSLKSLLKFPDTWEPIRRLGREIHMLEPWYLEGDAYQFVRRTRADGTPDWDLASIAAPSAALLFANDTSYEPDPQEKIFKFGNPREVEFSFKLPPWLRKPVDVFRIDADGAHEVAWSIEGVNVIIKDTRTLDALYVVAANESVRQEILLRRMQAMDHESANAVDLPEIQSLQP